MEISVKEKVRRVLALLPEVTSAWIGLVDPFFPKIRFPWLLNYTPSLKVS